jgi:hypothetical protein
MISHKNNKVIISKLERIYRGFTKSIIFILFPIVFLTFAFTIVSDNVPPGMGVPFHPGEKLTYKATWGIIPAGELTVTVLPEEIFKGIEVYHFVMIAKTSKVVDLLYKIRERQDSYVDIGMTHSILYKKKMKVDIHVMKA